MAPLAGVSTSGNSVASERLSVSSPVIVWQKDEVIENAVFMEILGRFLVLFKKIGEGV